MGRGAKRNPILAAVHVRITVNKITKRTWIRVRKMYCFCPLCTLYWRTITTKRKVLHPILKLTVGGQLKFFTWFVMSTRVFFPASKCKICRQKWMYCCPLLRYASRVCESKTPGRKKRKVRDLTAQISNENTYCFASHLVDFANEKRSIAQLYRNIGRHSWIKIRSSVQSSKFLPISGIWTGFCRSFVVSISMCLILFILVTTSRAWHCHACNEKKRTHLWTVENPMFSFHFDWVALSPPFLGVCLLRVELGGNDIKNLQLLPTKGYTSLD